MAETKRIKVFLCHAHSDAAAVRDLFRYLRREGVDVWLDKESLLPGADWEFEIRKAVRASDVVVVCLSKQFNKAGYRQKEVRIALDTEQEKPEGEIFIIPARLEVCDVPESLSKWQWVDLFEEGGRRKLIRALRIRADQIGASLRRRGNYGKPISQDETDYPDDKADVAVKPLHEIFAARRTVPKYLQDILREREKKQQEKEEKQRIQKLETPSGFWVDDKWNVYRGSKKLGILTSEVEYKVIKCLIASKGSLVKLSRIYRLAFAKISAPTVNNPLLLLDDAIKNIRKLIEEDSEHPKYLTQTNHGYKLDW
jgi:hypothetical protein